MPNGATPYARGRGGQGGRGKRIRIFYCEALLVDGGGGTFDGSAVSYMLVSG